MTRPARQVRFVRAKLEKTVLERCMAEVELLGTANTYVGHAEGGCVDAAALRSAAQAGSDALHHRWRGRVEMVQIFDKPTVAVHVTARYEGDTRELVGCCLAGGDPLRAAVLAVLNATNRFLDIG